jgi:hypothetical protein
MGHRARTAVSKESFPDPEFPTIKNNRPVCFIIPDIVISFTIEAYYLDKNVAHVIDEMLDTGFLILYKRGILSILLMEIEQADLATEAIGCDGRERLFFSSNQYPNCPIFVPSLSTPAPQVPL